MSGRRVTLVALVWPSLLGTALAFGRPRDYEREANARGLNLEVYLRQLHIENTRAIAKQETKGGDAPPNWAYPPYWLNGYHSGFQGSDPGDLGRRDRSFRHGYAAGTRRAQIEAASAARAEAKAAAEAAARPEASWETAQLFAQRYREHLDGINRASVTLYKAGVMTKVEAELLAKIDMTVDDSIAYNELATGRTKAKLEAHLLLQKEASEAEGLRPQVREAFARLIEEVQVEIAKATLKGDKEVLHVKAEELSAIVENLRNPITLPGDFENLGTRLREFARVLETALKVDRLRKTVGMENLAAKSARVAYEQHVRFYESWRKGQLREWRASHFPRFSTPFRVPPREVTDEAGGTLAAIPGKSSDETPDVAIVTASMSGPDVTEPPETTEGVTDPVGPSETSARMASRIGSTIALFVGVVIVVFILTAFLILRYG